MYIAKFPNGLMMFEMAENSVGCFRPILTSDFCLFVQCKFCFICCCLFLMLS